VWKMKTLRIGVIILIIGVSLLIATIMRGKTIISTSFGQKQLHINPFTGNIEGGNPHLLEPRQTTIILRSASGEMVTIHVVRAKSWEATLNISLADPVFTVEGMRRLYAATFKPAVRGLYYFIVTTPDGRLVDEVELKFEQAGLAQDLYIISVAAIVIGTAVIAYNGLKQIIRKKKIQHPESSVRFVQLCFTILVSSFVLL